MMDSLYEESNDETWGYVSSEMFKLRTGKDYEGYNDEPVEQMLHSIATVKARG
jgi:hypothetical protein